METGERVLELEHQDTLNSMNNLASTYLNQGRHKVAERLGDACHGDGFSIRTHFKFLIRSSSGSSDLHY